MQGEYFKGDNEKLQSGNFLIAPHISFQGCNVNNCEIMQIIPKKIEVLVAIFLAHIEKEVLFTRPGLSLE